MDERLQTIFIDVINYFYHEKNLLILVDQGASQYYDLVLPVSRPPYL